MDEENDQDSLGAYNNMERANIRPNFASEALGNSAANFFRDREESAKNTAENTAKDVAGAASQKVASKVAEKGLDAATGGVGGKVLKAAEKSGAARAVTSAKSPKIKGKVALKKALPIVLIAVFIMGGIGILGTSSFSLFGKAFSSLMKRKTDTSVSVNHKVTDYQINNTQLGGANGSSEYGETAFDNVSLSDYQIQSFKQAGLEYVEGDDGTGYLVHNNFDGSKTYIAPDIAVTGTAYYGDEIIGEGNETYLDAGASDGKSEEERIAEIEIALNVPEGSKVVKFSEALKDFNIKNEYIAATDAYRGGMGAWYSDTANTTTERLGISLNNWQNFEDTGDNAANEEAVIQMAAKTSANEDNDVKSVSYDELAKSVAEQSKSTGCGYASAASVVGSVANAGETYKQTTAGALMMEAIDKTIAGQGSKAPMNAILNLLFKAGGTDTESMHNLFGNTKLDQSSSDILDTNAQANLGTNVNLDDLGDAKTEAETCMYIGNVNEHQRKGFIETIGSMFKSIGSWISSKVKSIVDYVRDALSGGTESAAAAVVSALDPAVSVFDKMKSNTYFTGHDDKKIGEAMVNSTELITNEMSKSVTATMPGDTGAVKTAYRVQQEVIAEKAEYDRTTLSPFDPSSENTFVGKIAYSLIPFATSNATFSLTSTVSKLGSLLSGAATSLLPTSSAVSETELELSLGDCPYSNSVAAFSNARCNNYQTFNLISLMQNPAEIFNKVASLRIDDEDGYVFGINKNETEAGYYTDYDREDGHVGGDDYRDGTGRDYNDPDYGNEALNPEENNLPSHWGTGDKEGEGTAHGCESDWQYEIRYHTGSNGVQVPYRYYNFDLPTEWKYTRLTNFEYEGYKTGWPNLTSANSAGKESAKNDVDPGQCQLDLKTDQQKQPVINVNSMLGMFILMSGQRTTQIGIADEGNVDALSKTDFLHGRLNPCYVADDNLFICSNFKDNNGWSSDKEEVMQDTFLSRLIGGSAFTNYTGVTDMMKKGYENDEIFRDPTMDNNFFSEEMKYYSAYISLIEWMDANNLLTTAGDAIALNKYYKENPLDNSYEGILARYSGHSKDTVIAVLNLVNYAEWLANYDPSSLYPLTPKSETTILYDNPEVVAVIPPAIKEEQITYDELRNRAVTV
ncbi:hypothetical protein IJH10_01395 [Candidatus Saccharibacteria bacterium]|nr:hypothetical protein [Candidatus Saccharibacteria bacterium]